MSKGTHNKYSAPSESVGKIDLSASVRSRCLCGECFPE
jgi:hypothetical protein